MTLQAFIDDSGSSPDEPVMVLAGYIADASQWAAFANEWHAILDESPTLEYFKMAEAMSLRGQFSPEKGWDSDTRNKRLIRLSQTIKGHVAHQLCASIMHEDFQNSVRSLPAMGFRTLSNDHPYTLLWHKLVSEFLLVAPQMKIREPVDFIFDEQQGFDRETEMVWDMIQLNIGDVTPWSNIVGNRPTYKDEKEFLPLQAADMLAWLNRRSLDDSADVSDIPIEVLENLEPISCLHIKVRRDWMERWTRIMSARAAEIIALDPDAPLISYNPKATKRERKMERQRARKAETQKGGSQQEPPS